MTYNSNQDILSQFIVIDNGHIDEARIDEQEKNIRRLLLSQKTREIGREITQTTLHGVVMLAKFAGQATMQLFDEAARAGSN